MKIIMNKREAKKEISELIKKYQRIVKEGKIKSYNEARTRNEFIEPLFGFLGWDMRNANNDNEVTTEETISRGRVDLAFRINGIPKFFLEAKSLKVDLDIESYARQAINYSWNKGINWAVLTDFESIKIFNANAKSKSLRDKLVFEISHDEYIKDFERLWLLSRESFEKNALDTYAEKHGKKSKSLTVNEKLFGDLKQAREILTKSFDNWKECWDKNKNTDQETLDEGVQRIIDRLVFIRVLEDKKLEEPILQPIVREWEKDRSNNKQLFQMLTEKFRELDDIYNSSLFTKHACENWEEYDDATKKAIALLYGNDVYEYNFKEIPADILGGVYESYLGYIAQKPIKAETKKKSGKLSKTKNKKDLKIKSRQKRKEQGIYYTPNFIVDYIVKNTLGKKLAEIKNENDLKKIKILDPACGSGSFLIKALETVNEKYKDFGNPSDQFTKSEILLSNIYGVDLDPQAVELAKLNLLINALDQQAKLPNLTDNIRVGNSLISGSEKELKKYFGKSWRDKKPFNWEEEFPFCHSRENGNPEDGFDVVIGNSPYITLALGKKQNFFSENDIKYFNDNYKDVMEYKGNTYALFIAKSISLLKDDGLFSFIIPNTILLSSTFKNLRKFILDHCSILYLANIKAKVFGSAETGGNLVFVLKKKKAEKNHKVKVIEISEIDEFKNIKNYQEILQQSYCDDEDCNFFTDISSIDLMNKIKNNTVKLNDIADFYNGIKTGDNKKFISDSKADKRYKEIIRGRDVERYKLCFGNKFILFDKDLLWSNTNEEKLTKKPKIIMRQTGDKLTGVIDKQGYMTMDTTHLIFDTKIDIYTLLAILNSSLMNWFYQKMTAEQGKVFAEIKIVNLKKLPIKKITDKEQKILANFVKKILKLNKQLQSTPENSDKWNAVKKEIGKVDGEIDERVFELYNLTEKEVERIGLN
jgi:type I restriction-modification system DNA methylase subunit